MLVATIEFVRIWRMVLALGSFSEIGEVVIREASVKMGWGGGDFDIQLPVSVGR